MIATDDHSGPADTPAGETTDEGEGMEANQPRRLIESAPKYQQYVAACEARRRVERLFNLFFGPLLAALAGYRSELRHMLDAPIYLGPGR
ncbi:MAG TPA: hypothetical protein PK440_00665 [Candidatus Accumulibacter phosphatis]|nr:MAG: hypothetical protein AW07_00467 [Candidatus Accumulibacter sp. SK-11]HAY28976.1 hypothetical protein [Accumulibacter sp.]HCN67269.1 hypothetical protein [Accumulibacter sp.]HRL74224.1 hypothetical protein [Candidatus Accumulibacter phosphatis]HRQ93514.1 hypothetical protein [Candidatus Accumulibacter phosphatis]